MFKFSSIKNKKIFSIKMLSLAVILFFLTSIILETPKILGQEIEAIKGKIDQKNVDIKKLQQEIEEYQKTLTAVGKETQSLKKEITTLTVSKKKIDTDIKLTEANIGQTSSSIKKLDQDIVKKESEIGENVNALKETIRNIRDSTNVTFLERVLAKQSISDYLETNEKFEELISNETDELQTLKAELEQRKAEAEGKKVELSNLKTDLSGKKQAVVQTEKQKDSLLKVTQNQEANYKKILAEKMRLKEQFEKELFAYEAELQIAIDPSKLPTGNNSALSWPLDTVRITQLFGKTAFSGRLYTSGTHNGVDFGAPLGTPVKAVLSGVVMGTGNTDLAKGCYSYGKWVLLKHSNGLSTVYGHLSAVSVAAGQTVATGQIIAHSGQTGYSTGPHLHLSVFASEGVRVGVIPNEKTVNCRGVTIPLALGANAFLDPMIYLPK